MIMEDEILLQNLLKKKLEKNGYEVTTADDGKEGMDALISGYLPDLILLDIIMPKKNGFEVLQELKENEKLSAIPIIIISNSGQPVEIKKIKEFGVVDYLVKADFNPEDVLQKVGKFFNPDQDLEEKETAQENSEEEEEIQVEKQPTVDSETNSVGIKVILAEDDDFLRDICETKLKKEGFDVTVACNGAEALEKIMQGNPDIILLDVIMPEKDGFEVLKTIKEIPEKANIPVIMLTNLGQASEIEKGFSLGATDYIIKAHFTVGEIIDKVKDILAKKK